MTTSSTGWNQETKARLTEKLALNMNDLASLTRQILRGSRSNELLEKSAKNFASQELNIENSSTTLKRMGLLVSHLQFQAEAAERSLLLLENVQDHLTTIQRRL